MLVVRSAVVGPFAENAYVVADDATGDALLVDPGGDVERLLSLCEPGGFRVGRIFLTHGHIDHVAGCAEAAERLGNAVPIGIHRADQEWLDALPRQAELFGLASPEEVPPIAHYHEHGEVLTMGGHQARVIHTPGHSAGSCCLHFEADGVVLVGDTLFAGSVGRTDLPGGDFEVLERSVRERLFTLGDDVRFLPGHGPEGRVGDERLGNPFVGEGARDGFP